MHRAGRSGRYNYTGNSYVFLDENNYYAITRLQKKGIVWNNIKFNKDDFIEFNYKFKKVERKETEVDVQIRKVISTASKRVKPNYKKKVKLQIQEIKKEPYSVTREVNGLIPELQQAIDNGFVRFRYDDNSAIVIDTYGKKIHELDYNNKLVKTSNIKSEFDIKLFKRALAVLNGFF